MNGKTNAPQALDLLYMNLSAKRREVVQLRGSVASQYPLHCMSVSRREDLEVPFDVSIE